MPGMNRDSSFSASGPNSFMRNEMHGFGLSPPFSTPLNMNLSAPSTGISFSKEFENLLQYIAITAGNTKMPEGIKPMSFRP